MRIDPYTFVAKVVFLATGVWWGICRQLLVYAGVARRPLLAGRRSARLELLGLGARLTAEGARALAELSQWPQHRVDIVGAGALLPSLQALASKANTETDAGLARFLAYSRLTELDSTGTKVRPRPRAVAA